MAEPTTSAAGPLRWGWFAVIYGLDGGPWCQPTEAATIIPGSTTRRLRQWAGRGLISVIHEPGCYRRYLRPELERIAWETRYRTDPSTDLLEGLITLAVREQRIE